MKESNLNAKNLNTDAEIASGLQTSPLVIGVWGETESSIQKK